VIGAPFVVLECDGIDVGMLITEPVHTIVSARWDDVRRIADAPALVFLSPLLVAAGGLCIMRRNVSCRLANAADVAGPFMRLTVFADHVDVEELDVWRLADLEAIDVSVLTDQKQFGGSDR